MLPRRVGKAYAEFTADFAQLEAAPSRPRRIPDRGRTDNSYVIGPEGSVRPHVDFDKPAGVLLVIARDEAEKKKVAQISQPAPVRSVGGEVPLHEIVVNGRAGLAALAAHLLARLLTAVWRLAAALPACIPRGVLREETHRHRKGR